VAPVVAGTPKAVRQKAAVSSVPATPCTAATATVREIDAILAATAPDSASSSTTTAAATTTATATVGLTAEQAISATKKNRRKSMSTQNVSVSALIKKYQQQACKDKDESKQATKLAAVESAASTAVSSTTSTTSAAVAVVPTQAATSSGTGTDTGGLRRSKRLSHVLPSPVSVLDKEEEKPEEEQQQQLSSTTANSTASRRRRSSKPVIPAVDEYPLKVEHDVEVIDEHAAVVDAGEHQSNTSSRRRSTRLANKAQASSTSTRTGRQHSKLDVLVDDCDDLLHQIERTVKS